MNTTMKRSKKVGSHSNRYIGMIYVKNRVLTQELEFPRRCYPCFFVLLLNKDALAAFRTPMHNPHQLMQNIQYTYRPPILRRVVSPYRENQYLDLVNKKQLTCSGVTRHWLVLRSSSMVGRSLRRSFYKPTSIIETPALKWRASLIHCICRQSVYCVDLKSISNANPFFHID